jgi:hypothetical protein
VTKKAFGSVKRTAARASRPGAVIHRQVRAGRSGVNNEQPPPPSSDGLSEVRSPLMVSRARKFSVVCLHPRRIYKLARPHAGAMYSRRPAALTLPHGGRLGAGIRCGMRAEHAIIISCEHSLLAGEACFETKVRIRRENPCTHDMPHASIPAERGGRMGVGGELKKKARITTKARYTHLWRHSEPLS